MLVTVPNSSRNNTGFGLLLHPAAAKMRGAVALARYGPGSILSVEPSETYASSQPDFMSCHCKNYLTESIILLQVDLDLKKWGEP
jgi:hypothetical protein